MIPFIRSLKLLIWMFFYDENAFRRWMRLLVVFFAVSGMLYSSRIEAIFGHKVSAVWNGVCVLAAIIVAIHGEKVESPKQ